MISSKKGMFGDNKEKKFWGTSELVARLFSYMEVTPGNYLQEDQEDPREPAHMEKTDQENLS